MLCFGGIIILTLPLAIVGAVIGLTMMQADFGFMVIPRLLTLAGSIGNNGFVMIDLIEKNPRGGQTLYDAVVNSAVSRLRPILLSVSTTVLRFSLLIINPDPLFFGMASVMSSVWAIVMFVGLEPRSSTVHL